MSTAEVFLDADEIKEFIHDTLEDDYLNSIGPEGREIGLCPVVTFYIYNTPEEYLGLCERVTEVFNRFEADMLDKPFTLKWHGYDQEWLKSDDARLPKDLTAYAAKTVEEARDFFVRATDMEGPSETARWAFSAVVSDGIGARYTRVKLTFRNRWYRQNQLKWQQFVRRCIEQLRPDQCYSGFEVGNGGFNILGAYECDVMERICADYFFGMDIDHPAPMSFHNYNEEDGYYEEVSLAGGIRTPTWCFLLSPYWLTKLGKTEAEVRAELSDPRIEITSIPYPANKIYPQGGNALWIRLGELDLYPVEQGLPYLLVQASRLIKPIRCDHLQLLTLAPWEGDPNPRFDYNDSLRWMRRFDADSNWPDAQRRVLTGPHSEAVPRRLRGLPGEVVPRAGRWTTPALGGASGNRVFKAGDRFPDLDRTDYGAVIWQWDFDQQG